MEIQVLRTREEFLALENEWRSLYEETGRPDFYLSYDWFYAMIYLAQKPPENQYIMTVREGQKLLAILPFCLGEQPVRLFKHRSLEIIGNIYTPYRACLVRPERRDCVARSVSWYLHDNCRNDWEIINFEGVSTNDNFLTSFNSVVSDWDTTVRWSHLFSNIIADCKNFGTSDEFFKAHSTMRKQVKNKFNRMRSRGSIDVVVTSKADQNIEQAMSDYYSVYNDSWKEGERFDPQFHLHLAKFLAKSGSLRLFTLYFDQNAERPVMDSINCSPRQNDGTQSGIAIASAFFIVADGKAYYLKTVYREKYADVSPGTLLTYFAFRHLIDSDKVCLVDYQKGDDPYKFRSASFNENRYLYQAANPRSLRARFDLWFDHKIVPAIRKLLVCLRLKKMAQDEAKAESD